MAATQRFRDLVAGGGDFALDEALALIAIHAGSRRSVEALLTMLDEVAASCPSPQFDVLLQHLFGPGRFAGNTADYYDPRNSLLDHVVERRLGIPISLATLAIEVGRRVGLDVAGVGMPGHFLICERGTDTFADPFAGPALLDRADCRRIYSRLAVPSPWSVHHLDEVSTEAIVIRVLTNLKANYQQRNDIGNLRWVMTLRAAIPSIGPQERDEFRRLMARLN
jgi:regulator of sirC expression with transglutaminase-like and TPR domain